MPTGNPRIAAALGDGGVAPVAEVLDVDREYRHSASGDALPKIAPLRFNPERKAWLPILHTARGDRHYTVLFSNTALAHRLGRTHDWVVVYYDGRGRERQNTVITARRGPLRGRRIVRGRESETARHYGISLEEPVPVLRWDTAPAGDSAWPILPNAAAGRGR